jgi:arylsulfatase
LSRLTPAAGVIIERTDAEGVLLSQGAEAGGHALYVKHGRLHYVYNWLGERIQEVHSDSVIPTGKHVLTAEFEMTGDDERTQSAMGTLKLYVDSEAVGSSELMTQPGAFGLSGSGLAVGRSGASPPSPEIRAPFPFKGGTIDRVIVDVPGDPFVNHEKEVLAYLARD